MDGKLSIQCYLSSLDKCYKRFADKAKLKNSETVSLDSFDGLVFHSPYCKLVQKSLARLLLNDAVNLPESEVKSKYPELESLRYRDAS